MDRKNKKQNKRKVGRIALLGLLFLVVLASWRLPETFTPHEGLATPLSAAAAFIGADTGDNPVSEPAQVLERARDAERVTVRVDQGNVQLITTAREFLPENFVGTSTEIAQIDVPVWQGVYASGTPGFGGGGGAVSDFTRHALVDDVTEVYTPSFSYISSTTTGVGQIDSIDITQIFPCSE